MKFETSCCSRCGGTGSYSYCPGYGTMCFKCRGKGVQYTARGQRDYDAWRAAVDAATVRPVAALRVGDWAKCDALFPKYYRVADIDVDGDVYRVTFDKEIAVPSPCGMIREKTWEVTGTIRIHAGDAMPKAEAFDSRVTA